MDRSNDTDAELQESIRMQEAGLPSDHDEAIAGIQDAIQRFLEYEETAGVLSGFVTIMMIDDGVGQSVICVNKKDQGTVVSLGLLDFAHTVERAAITANATHYF